MSAASIAARGAAIRHLRDAAAAQRLPGRARADRGVSVRHRAARPVEHHRHPPRRACDARAAARSGAPISTRCSTRIFSARPSRRWSRSRPRTTRSACRRTGAAASIRWCPTRSTRRARRRRRPKCSSVRRFSAENETEILRRFAREMPTHVPRRRGYRMRTAKRGARRRPPPHLARSDPQRRRGDAAAAAETPAAPAPCAAADRRVRLDEGAHRRASALRACARAARSSASKFSPSARG